MTDGLDQALARAGLDRLEADVGLTVFDGKVDDDADILRGYALVYSNVAWPPEQPDHNLTNASTIAVTRWICHCVGATELGARAIAARVKTQLLDHKPTVPGVVCNATRQVEVRDPIRDESTNREVQDLIAVYEMRASK